VLRQLAVIRNSQKEVLDLLLSLKENVQMQQGAVDQLDSQLESVHLPDLPTNNEEELEALNNLLSVEEEKKRLVSLNSFL